MVDQYFTVFHVKITKSQITAKMFLSRWEFNTRSCGYVPIVQVGYNDYDQYSYC